jgi:hypothetical protein
MDKRKNNGGHSNGGRKPKADEIKLIEQMDAVLVPKSVWKALAIKVESGDGQCIKTWLSYRYGMPKQQIEQTNVNVNPELTEKEKQDFKEDFLKDY